jgi:DHA3 family macrolide efflux protein-like MFS transporter
MNCEEQRSAKWAIPFFTIWTGQQLSLIGSSLAQFALVWWVTETTGSATMLLTATIVALLPNIFLGPFVGALVDRWNRRVVMIVADGFVALVAAWLAYLFWADAMQIWHVYIIMLARAIGGRFHRSAMLASTSLMVPQERLPRVAGLSQTVMGAVDIISPPLGALLLDVLQLHSIMAIDVVTAAFAIAPLFLVPIPQPKRSMTTTKTNGNKPTLWDDTREGLRYIWGWPGLGALCIMAMLLNFLAGPAFYLVPILVTKHFGGGALQLSWVNSAWGIGAVLGGLIISVWGGFRRHIVTLLLTVIWIGAGLLIVALAPATAFPLALVGLFVLGTMASVQSSVFPVLLQGIVAPEMQGRVFATFGSLVSGMLTLGMVTAGPVADALGVRVPYLVGGVAQVLIGLGDFFVPVLMHLEDDRHTQF